MSSSRGGRSRPEWDAEWASTPPRTSVKRFSSSSLLSAIAGVTASFAIGLTAYLLSTTGKVSNSILLGVFTGATVAIATAVFVVFIAINQRNSISSLRVAVLGMPQVGKTTLITACFQEIFSRRVNIRAVMSGKRSFEALNNNISRLAAGLPLEPTKDQDVAAYRFEIEPTGLLSPRYRVEFGDFPGEDTKKYIEEYGPWLHKTPFFEWALTCDAFVFCVNAGPLQDAFKNSRDLATGFFASPEFDRAEQDSSIYVAESSAAIRAAWQHIVASFGSRRTAYLRRYPLLLVFTKVDLLFREPYAEQAPRTMEIRHRDVHAAETWLTGRFGDLVRYLEEETKNFSVVATSSFATTDKARLGISEFLHKILPSGAFISAPQSKGRPGFLPFFSRKR